MIALLIEADLFVWIGPPLLPFLRLPTPTILMCQSWCFAATAVGGLHIGAMCNELLNVSVFLEVVLTADDDWKSAIMSPPPRIDTYRLETPANLPRLNHAIKLIRRSTQHLRAFFTDQSFITGEDLAPPGTSHAPSKCFFSFVFPGRKYDSGEHLNITSITRDQAGDYECSALNDIASPDTQTVKVTVNCKCAYRIAQVRNRTPEIGEGGVEARQAHMAECAKSKVERGKKKKKR